MAGEIQATATTGWVLYALVRNATGSVWSTVGSAFEAYATANLADYDIALTEQGTASGYYAGTFPAAATGTYSVVVYRRVGGAPAEGDTVVATGRMEWDGSVVVPLSSRLAPTDAGRTLDVSAGGEAGVDWANVGTPGSTVNLSATTVNLVNTITTYTGNTVQTGDSFARLGAPAGASVSADILTIDNLVDDLESRIGTPSDLGGGATVAANLADIEAQTDDIGVAGAGLTGVWSVATRTLTSAANITSTGGTTVPQTGDSFARIGAAGASLTAVPWNAAWDAEVQSECDDAIAARFTFTVAGFADANIQYVNDVLVGGTGVVGNTWGPA